ncbi:MAG: carbonic anhydrase [Clostridia bacterium]|nr:carbonic anhydrase [Clostridia bacterium]
MDYKKVLKSRKLRMAILDILSFIPDKAMIKLQYKIKTGRKLNLKDPERYTEKLQWYKLYYRDSVMAQCADKFDVREYVKEQGFPEILNECYGVYADPGEIDFSVLPEKFVLKDTLGGGGSSVIICTDKEKADIESFKKQMQYWVNTKPVKSGGREWVYYSGKPRHRIICEKYIEAASDMGLTDFKFFCFGGKCKYVYVITNRRLGQDAEIGIYDRDYNLLPYYRVGEGKPVHLIEKPQKFDKMLEIAEKLSARFPHVRVDLFCENDQITFGELTFFNGSGYIEFDPDEFDFILGKEFVLPPKNN